jgi:hypothetical protein
MEMGGEDSPSHAAPAKSVTSKVAALAREIERAASATEREVSFIRE